MKKQLVYVAVMAIVENGKITGLAMDSDALVGSPSGSVFNVDTERWTNDGPVAEAFLAVSDALNGGSK